MGGGGGGWEAKCGGGQLGVREITSFCDVVIVHHEYLIKCITKICNPRVDFQVGKQLVPVNWKNCVVNIDNTENIYLIW